MLVTDDGIVIDFILRASKKANCPIIFTVDGIVYVVAVLPIGYKFKTDLSLLNR